MATNRSSRAVTPQGPHSACVPGAPAAPAPAPPTLDWADPTAVEAWARDLCVHVQDAVGAGEDATRPPGGRELGRRAARRLILEAEKNLTAAFGLARIDVTKV